MLVSHCLRYVPLILVPFAAGGLAVRTTRPASAVGAARQEVPQQLSKTLGAGDPDRPPGTDSARAVLLIPLDLSGDVPLTAPQDGVEFDIDADGRQERVAWTRASSSVAFVFWDKTGDGVVKNGGQLVGGSTTPEAWNGFMALGLLARDAGGAIKPGHPMFSQLFLWVDRNHNGRSDSTEIQAVGAVFQQIGLGYFKPKRVAGPDANGNVFRWEGWLQRVGVPIDLPGGYSPAYDVVLQVAR